MGKYEEREKSEEMEIKIETHSEISESRINNLG